VCCRNKISGTGAVNTRHEFLRVPVDQREPCRLNLYHQPMSFQKDVVMVAQRNLSLFWLAWSQRLWMFEALEVTAPPDFHRDG
jgi:hypothetical protein